MLTEFGKLCRKLRIDQGEILHDMAQKLNVSTSFLSAVELGKKAIPSNWANQISTIYNLQTNEINKLNEAIINSTQSVNFDLRHKSPNSRYLAIALSRKFDELSEEDITSIKAILEQKNDKGGGK